MKNGIRPRPAPGMARVALAVSLGAAPCGAVQMQELSSSGLVTGPQRGEPLQIASEYLKDHVADLGLAPADVSDAIVQSWHTSSTDGVTHIYMRQRFQGIEVFDGNLYFHILPDGSIASVQTSFIPGLAAAVPTTVPVLSARDAVARAARAVGLSLPPALTVRRTPGGAERAVLFDGAGFAASEVPVRLVFQRDGGGRLLLAWDLSIELPDGRHWWSTRVDALSGEMVEVDDWVDTASFKVFPVPVESPNHTTPAPPADGRTLLNNPEDPTASPTGWVAAQCTEGPNVRAVADTAGNNNGTNTACGGSPFNFAIDWAQQPTAGSNQGAAIVNLFYWNNVIHDILHHRGFTRAAGNFEGSANRVYADAQDGSGTNNANFSTPPNGANPRMQMFLWDPPPQKLLHVVTPSAASYVAIPSQWPPAPGPAPQPTLDFVLVDDGAGTTSDACETPFRNAAALVGKIAVVDRGTCTFVVKEQNVQAAGALAMVVATDAARPAAITMGGTPSPAATIPSVMISYDDGVALKAMLPGATGRLETPAGSAPRLDGDYDSGVIAHEYGHGVSNRLVGGPSNTSCLNNCEQMGEGWSDLLGLIITAKPTDTAAQPRGIGTYVVGQGPSGPGIRSYPYSTSTTLSPYVHSDIASVASCQPHAIGEVWASIVWEVYWAFTGRDGFSPDLKQTPPVAGNVKFLQWMLDGMKNCPCRPTFCSARNALLNAIQAGCGSTNPTAPNEDCCLAWAAFAKRGLGTDAACGTNTSTTNNTDGFATPPSCVGVGCPTAPGRVEGLMGVKSADDVVLSWNLEASATGGYRIYRAVDDKTLILQARGPSPPPGVTLDVTTPAGPPNTTATITGAVQGPADTRFYYQVLALCSDLSTEGPN